MKLSLPQMSKEKLQQIILTGIITAAVSSGIYIFYVSRQLKSIKESQQQMADLEAKIRGAEVQAKQDRKMSEQHPQIQAFVEEQQAGMVTGDPFSWCVRQVSLLSEKHSVRVLGMRPGLKAHHPFKERYEVFDVTLEVEGSYDDLGIFLRDLENRYGTAEIRKVELQSAADATAAQRHLVLNVAFLMLPEKPAATGKGA